MKKLFITSVVLNTLLVFILILAIAKIHVVQVKNTNIVQKLEQTQTKLKNIEEKEKTANIESDELSAQDTKKNEKQPTDDEIETCTLIGLSKDACKNALGYYYSEKQQLKNIENETQACLDRGIAMQNCCWDAIDKYEAEIPKIMEQFKKILPKETYDKLALSQKKWEEFFKLDVKANNDMFYFKMGHIAYTIGAGYLMNSIKDYTKNLLYILNDYIMLQ